MPLRLDYQFIEKHIPRGARVLDLGCGDGRLLEELIRKDDVEGLGIDVDETAAKECISRGVPVYHGDMFEGIQMFSEDSFDCVILSRTLQQSLNPRKIVNEMLRVGQRGIISFPNFGHWSSRLKFCLAGKRPVTGKQDNSWHETPNVHPLTINDFISFCDEEELTILDRVSYTSNFYKLPSLFANLFASYAVFVIRNL